MAAENFAILYTSKCSEELTETLLNEILQKARPFNDAHAITGFLVAREGYFLQVIEGDESEVRALFAKIRKDPRHSEVVMQAEVRLSDRLFPGWSMARVDQFRAADTANSLLELFEAGRKGEVHRSADALLLMVRKFGKDAILL